MLFRRARVCLIPLLIIAALATSAFADVTIHCLYVGQADATLIQSSSGQTLLFDGGNNGDGDDIIVPYLTSLGITQLDYMAASHYHSDHCGGLDEVYDAVGVANAVYDRGWDYSTATYSSYASTVSAKRQTAVDGQVIDLGDGVTCTVVAVNGNGQSGSPYNSDSHENEYGLALLVECGDFDFFVAGDLTGGYSSEEDIETSVGAEIGDIEVYQVDHHGSYTSSNTNFLNSTTPEVAIISVPVSSSYGHPHQDPLDRMAAKGMYIYQTAQGSSATYTAGQRSIINTVDEEHASARHIVITSDGYGEYFVDGDQWTMDEPDVTAVPDLGSLVMRGNTPNPFNPATEIMFETRDGGPVRLTVYDLAGRVLRSEAMNAAPGSARWLWNGRDKTGRSLPSGVYMYRVISREGIGTGRMTLAR
jgi:beta-lactamase superfamily II metal-dependent hydrolase